MATNKLLPEVQTIYGILAAANATLHHIQEMCEHPAETLRKEYKANTGNYDPSSDKYWVEFWCELCNKQWSADANTEEYKREGMIYDKWHDGPRLG